MDSTFKQFVIEEGPVDPPVDRKVDIVCSHNLFCVTQHNLKI